MRYKLLVLDVDGTLVKDNTQNISLETISAIRGLKDKLSISLCTGRSLADLDQVIDLLGLQDSYHVVESGSKVLAPGLAVEFVKALSREDCERVVTEFFPHFDYGICVDGDWRKRLDEVNHEENITTLTFYIEDVNKADLIMRPLEKYQDKYHISLTSHWSNPNGRQILITNKEASKEKSLAYLQNKLNITIEETVCIGDMPNDIPMFQRSGYKICMGNGDQKLKDLADEVTSSVEEEGVANAISKLVDG